MNRSALVALPLRLRWYIWGVVGIIAAFLARADDPPDLANFAERGTAMLSGHLSQVYAGSWNQAGPLQLAGARLLLLGSSTGRPLFGIELAVDFALLALLRHTCRRNGTPAGTEFVLAGVAVVWLGPSGLWSGHPVEIAIPLLWLVAVRSAMRGRSINCGIALAIATLVAPWAILAAPLAFAGRTGGVRAIGVAVVTGLGGYLPFAATGHFGMFSNTWIVNSHTLVHLLAPDVVHFSWSLRLLQAAVAAIGCFVSVRWLRGRVDVRWLPPLVAVLLRILLDPVVLGYYWLPAGVLVIAGAALRCGAVQPLLSRRQAIALVALGYLTYFGATGAAPVLTGLGCLLAAALVAVPTGYSFATIGSRPTAYRRARLR